MPEKEVLVKAEHVKVYFKGKTKSKDKFEQVLSDKEINELLRKNDIILPKKRNYYIENLYSHYEHTLHIETLDITGEIIKEKYPKYSKEFDLLKKRTSAHMFNMCIMKKHWNVQ